MYISRQLFDKSFERYLDKTIHSIRCGNSSVYGVLAPGVMVDQHEALAVTTGLTARFIWFAHQDTNHAPLGH